jgi:hypothetical protein
LLGFDPESPAKSVVERPEITYPLARQKLKTYFLDACSAGLHVELPEKQGSVSYEAHHLTDCVVGNPDISISLRALKN